ncbi:uncharacterized, partial [Tachysurus ichikawai]
MKENVPEIRFHPSASPGSVLLVRVRLLRVRLLRSLSSFQLPCLYLRATGTRPIPALIGRLR